MELLLAFTLVLLPVFLFFALGLILLPMDQWIFAFMFAGMVTLTLVGCSIGGGYDVGTIWHYHGAPEHISRPDIESLRED
ncbi:MAG: hypothetical protein ACFFED_13925 [Candidatus Thorarchaeota archaeon]